MRAGQHNTAQHKAVFLPLWSSWVRRFASKEWPELCRLRALTHMLNCTSTYNTKKTCCEFFAVFIIEDNLWDKDKKENVKERRIGWWCVSIAEYDRKKGRDADEEK